MKRPLYLLCGGQSLRMGPPDKALLQLQGESLLDAQIQRGKSHFSEVILLSGSNSYERGLPELQDAIPDGGPLAGLLSAIRHARTKSIAIIPVDVPLLSDETLNHFAKVPLPENTDAVLAQSDERLQPLAGIYSTAIEEKLESFLDGGGRSVRSFLEEISLQTFHVKKSELLNVNRPEDYEKLKWHFRNEQAG